jgi:hypothetical protein
MRHLIILRGSSRTGRSLYAERQGLSRHKSDQADFASGQVARTGVIDHERSRQEFLEALSSRLRTGSLVVIEPAPGAVPENPHRMTEQDCLIQDAISISKPWRYQVIIIDFHRDGEQDAVATALDRRVGMQDMKDVQWLDASAKASAAILDHIEPSVIDLSAFNHIVAVGDIHGCSRTLEFMLGTFPERTDAAAIFLGDFISKGPRSAEVLRIVERDFLLNERAWALMGNHEECLEDWLNGIKPEKRAFEETVIPDFEDERYSSDQARAFLAQTIDGARFHWRGLDILATHGGFTRMPERLATISARRLHGGAGEKSLDVDAAWGRNVLQGNAPGPDRVVQIHGHRNKVGRPVQAEVGSFNLEGAVEVGGALRALVITGRDVGSCRMSPALVPNIEFSRTPGRVSIPEVA